MAERRQRQAADRRLISDRTAKGLAPPPHHNVFIVTALGVSLLVVH
jgi:hypothetical protein